MRSKQPGLALEPEAPLPEGEVLIEGTLDRFVYTKEDGTFAVARIRPDEGALITAVGPLHGLEVGDRVRLSGRWLRHPKHGPQLQVDYGYPLMPYTVEGIQGYLGAGHVPGIGPALAERLVQVFGADTLRIIEHHPEQLSEVEGIGPVRSASIQAAFQDKKLQREVLIFLQGHHIAPALAARIWRRYGGRAIATVRANPYQLAEEIAGVGFATADRVARALGFTAEAPIRAEAAVVHLLKAAAEEGHVYQTEQGLVEQADQMLGRAGAAEAVKALLSQGRIARDPQVIAEAIYLPSLLRQEQRVARRIHDLQRAMIQPWRLDLAGYEAEAEITLAPEQREALEALAHEALLVITGGPGTGKTTLIRGAVHGAEANGARISLAAPTGRAARRLSEATGRPASTLHRLLEYSPRSRDFKRGPDLPLAADVIIVDEVSMVDLELFDALVRAVTPGTRLVLVGDADQLPSVGPGNVLADLIAAQLPTARLQAIFRQREASRIVVNAHRILAGAEPLPDPPGPEGEWFTVPAADGEQALALITRLVAERVPQAFGLDPIEDVQVLAPMRRGACGAEALNAALQAALNPEGRLVGHAGQLFRVGDKVMQIRNDYEREVFNGDVGQIVAGGEGAVTVRFEGREVAYEQGALDALTLAYACTVHKSQGSEYPVVVIPVLTEHWMMLQRNLLYTGVTRARRLVVLVGQPRALSRAVTHQSSDQRLSALAARLARP